MRSILFFLTLSLSLPLFAAETDLTSAIESVRTGHFEPALESLTKLESESFLTENPTQAAEYWFYRAICEHQLFQKDACTKSLDQLDALAEKPDFELPARFSALSRLMRKDLETLKDESLEMISRRMKGVERQLGHGNGDEKVQKAEEEIVSLGKWSIDGAPEGYPLYGIYVKGDRIADGVMVDEAMARQIFDMGGGRTFTIEEGTGDFLIPTEWRHTASDTVKKDVFRIHFVDEYHLVTSYQSGADGATMTKVSD